MLLSALWALARLGVDPWQEATKLARVHVSRDTKTIRDTKSRAAKTDHIAIHKRFSTKKTARLRIPRQHHLEAMLTVIREPES
jgi:hypothetical protein